MFLAMWSYEKEQARLQKMLEIVDDEERQEIAYDDHSDIDQSDEEDLDHVEEQLDNSDSEQDISDDEEMVEESHSNTLSFLGKDKVTRWRKVASQPRTVKTRQINIVKRLPGSSLATKNLSGPLEIWQYFFNDEIINIILKCTNEYIEFVASNFARRRDATPTNRVEIRAFFGVIYMAGIYHANRLNAEELWSTDGSGVEIFRLAMSLQRFRFLIRCIRFDSKETRALRKETDKLAPIRNIFDRFVANCQNGFHLSEFVTVDEMLAGFRGKCGFRQYIPSKPNKYGIKILALCDATMFYTSKMEIYVGTQPEGPYRVSNSPLDVVLRLSQHISGSGRNVTMDNWFTSVPLVKTLRDRNLTVIGTIRKKQAGIASRIFSTSSATRTYKHVWVFERVHSCILYSEKEEKCSIAFQYA